MGEDIPRFRFFEKSCEPHPTWKTKNGYPKFWVNESRICIPCSPKLSDVLRFLFFIFIFFLFFSQNRNYTKQSKPNQNIKPKQKKNKNKT